MFRKKNFGRLIIALGLSLLTGFFLWQKTAKSAPSEAFVLYDGSSFSPQRVTVAENGKVIFKNESGKDFWPATDFHPDNGVYSDFNSKKPLPDGETWEFTFTEVGEWGYHNHLYPFHKGLVSVKSGLSISLFSKSDCGEVDNYQGRELCWYRQMKKEIQKKGINGALKLLAKLYSEEPLFGQGCHDITHLIGDEAYREFKSGKTFELGKEASYCGYGFYHGFIEAMLYTTTDYSEARSFCETLEESSNVIQACYHGIGHSTFDVHDRSFWGSEEKMSIPAIELCEKVTEGLSEEKTKQCVTGVFNALGIAYSNNQYNLEMRPEDPVWFCRRFSPLYKKACFIEVASAWVHKESDSEVFNFKDGANFISGLKDGVGEEAAMQALAAEYTRLRIGDFDNSEMVNNCRSVKSALFDPCMRGIEEGFFLWGKPEEEYKLAISFCSSALLTDDEKENCFENIMTDISGYYSLDKKRDICEKELDMVYRKFCEL